MVFGAIGISSGLLKIKGLKLKIPRELIQSIRKAQHLTVLTGAGISAESGIPTFREAQTGLWAKYDIFFSVGTSSVVQPAASLSVVALQKGASVIQLNPNKTPISILATHNLQGPSGEVLPQLIKTTWPGYE
jgi:NAD-dependent SIR2 family protein deacetylase